MTTTVTLAPVRKSISVKAKPERAFEMFAANMGRWWLRTHSINSAPMQDVVIEPRFLVGREQTALRPLGGEVLQDGVRLPQHKVSVAERRHPHVGVERNVLR